MDVTSAYLRAFGIGIVAGLRSMTAPAIARAKTKDNISAVLTMAMLGEMLVDKLPITPSRTLPVALVVRAISGGVSAAIVVAGAKDVDRRIAIGLGVVGAIAGSFAGERIRVTAAGKIPDTLVALVEDLVAFTLGSTLAPDA